VPLQPRSSLLTTVAVRRVSVHRGDVPVLVDVDVTVGPLDRIGVIGPNGVGKSTLLAVLSGGLRADAGRVELRPPHATVGLLAQERGAAVSRADPSETVREQLWRLTGASAAEAELEAAAGGLVTGARVAAERYAGALERYSALGVTTLEARLGAVARRERGCSSARAIWFDNRASASSRLRS